MFNTIKSMNKLFEMSRDGSVVVKNGRFCYVDVGEAKESFQADLDNWWSF